MKPLYSIPIAVAAIAMMAGCGQSGAQRASIQGKVTVGGQPLAKGRILFLPIAPNQGPATSALVEAGQYQIAKSEGPVAGKNRVEVEADLNLGFSLDDEAAFAKRGGKPLPPNPIPAEFNRQSKLVADIRLDTENNYDVAIPQSRHTAARPPY